MVGKIMKNKPNQKETPLPQQTLDSVTLLLIKDTCKVQGRITERQGTV